MTLTMIDGERGITQPHLSRECRRGGKSCEDCKSSGCTHRCHRHPESGPATDELERAA